VNPAPFLRGLAWVGGPGVPYTRADPADLDRLPADTGAAARTPVGVRIELTGTASLVRIRYQTTTGDLGYRGPGAGTTFEAWDGEECTDRQPAALGAGDVQLRAAGPGRRTIVYLPEGMHPDVLGVEGVDGAVEAAAPQPRWLAYGDSIVEGWVASTPPRAWPAVAGRRYGLDVVNLGYAGAARGEIPTAEQMAAVGADVISVSYGTNCWSRTPHSAGMVRAGAAAFLDVLRQGHPHTPIVVTSPVLRPDAEATANRLGATLEDLRAAIEDAALARVAAGDAATYLVSGRGVLDAAVLPDGIHPGDEGHDILAGAFGAPVASSLEG
jgi:lysophospholipase L1-like esterase